MNLTFYSLIY